jgi:hypothetical protein
MKIKNAITISGKTYIPVVTKRPDIFTDDCLLCALKNICTRNKDLYCFLSVFSTVFKESKLNRHFELVEEKEVKHE